MEKIIVVFILLIIAAYAGSFILQNNQNNKYNNWSEQCLKDSGIVMQTKQGIFEDRFECIKDGKFIDQID